MDPTILQFVAGMVAGALGGLIIVRRRPSSTSTVRHKKGRRSREKTLRSSSPVSKPRPNVVRATTIMKTIPASSVRLRTSNSRTRLSRPKNSMVVAAPIHHGSALTPPPTTVATLIPAIAIVPTAPTSTSRLTTSSVSACPACGLEAPEGLLAEHFLQSPSHRVPHVEPTIVVAVPSSKLEKREDNVKEEDQRLSFRNLLQILVPPRAFGHRAQQRGGMNSLSRMMQTVEIPVPRTN